MYFTLNAMLILLFLENITLLNKFIMNKVLLFFVTLSLSITSFADSPLTSTYFYKHYLDNSLVAEAQKTKAITHEMIVYILDADKPIEVKVAIINALGWGSNSNENYLELRAYAMNKYDVYTDKKLFDKIDGKVMVCFAYMKGLSDYFDVKDAVKMSKLAQKKDKDSYCVNIIAALIQAQEYFNKNRWDMIYSTVNQANNTTWKNNDISDEAAVSLMEYIGSYKEE